MQKSPNFIYRHTTKALLSFFLFVTNFAWAECEIGNCNDCTTLKSRCACIAMTYFQYLPVRHHNYKDDDDYEYVRLINCDPDKYGNSGITFGPAGGEENNDTLYECEFKYVRYRSCTTGDNASCDKNDKVITVRFHMTENNKEISFKEVTQRGNSSNCQPSTSDGPWHSYNLKVGSCSDLTRNCSVCFDRCAFPIEVNAGHPGKTDSFPLGTGGWCMVYGDLYKKAENGEGDWESIKQLRYISNDDEMYAKAGKTNITDYYCGNDVLKKYIDTTGDTIIDKTKTTEPVFFYGKVNTSGLVGMGKATCNAGQVWDNGKCVSCTSKSELVNYANENRMYCAGVKNISVIGLQLQDQLTKCPAGMWPTDDLKDCECGYGLETTKEGKCIGSLSYTDMYYGPSGLSAPLYKQCWTKSYDSKAYKKCMGFD